MPAPQQSSLPTYKETSNIPRARTYDNTYRASQMPGAALAEMLGAIPGAYRNAKASAEANAETNKPGPNEQAQMLALAQMGADKSRLRVAREGGFLGLIKGPEADLDVYNVERGRIDAGKFAGQLRDAYHQAGLHENADPAALRAFIEQQQGQMFASLGNSDPAYYHGYVTAVSSVYEEMMKAHAGHLDSFLEQENKLAFKSELGLSREVNLATRKNRSVFQNTMDILMEGESAGNYNAHYGNSGNKTVKFTEMTITDVRAWQRNHINSGGAGSAVGKYQLTPATFDRAIREMGINPQTTVFTPEVQDQIGWHLFMNVRGGKDWLAGKVSTEAFADRLAHEWAALKRSNGTGAYDGDGKNMATMSFGKTVAALEQFKAQFAPYLSEKTAAAGGTGVSLTTDDAFWGAEPDAVAEKVNNSEEGYGIANYEAREIFVEEKIEEIASNPQAAEDPTLDDQLRHANLSREQTERVHEARNEARQRLEAERRHQETIQRKELSAQTLSTIIEPTEENLQALYQVNPELSVNIRDRITSVTPSFFNPRHFLNTFDPSVDDAEEQIVTAFFGGQIDGNAAKAAMGQIETYRKTEPVFGDPGKSAAINYYRDLVPARDHDLFNRAIREEVAAFIAEFQRDPTVTEAISLAEKVHAAVGPLAATQAETRKAQYL